MEKVLFDEQGVLLTDKRFVSGNSVFPISAIVSIRLDKEVIKPQFAQWPMVLLMSMTLFFIIIESYLYSLISFTSCLAYIYIWRKQTEPLIRHIIYISTSGGDKEGVSSNDLNFINKIFNEFNQLIINRE